MQTDNWETESGEGMNLVLTETQHRICQAVYAAAMVLEKECGLNRYKPGRKIKPVLDALHACRLRPYFDLFRMVMSEKHDGIRHLTGVEDTSALIALYNDAFRKCSGGKFSPEQVVELQNRISAFIKACHTQNKTRPRKLYIADPHFFHGRLCSSMDRRGFSGNEEMTEYMIRQWNAKVTPKDEVFILGDFSLAGGDATNAVLEQLNGKKYLITGNHDGFVRDKAFDAGLFVWIKPYEEVRDNGRKVVLSHYPVFCYPGQYRKDKSGNPLTYMLYGHIHDTQDERLVHRFIMETRNARVKSRYTDGLEPISCNMINCFCMFSDYQPMTLDEWIEIDRKRRAELERSFTVPADTQEMMDSALRRFVNSGAAEPIDPAELEDDPIEKNHRRNT